MTALRGFLTANNSATGVTSVATSYTGWTTANPQPGDLIVAVILVAAASESITQTAGTGTWTIPSSDSNGGTETFTTAAAYRVMGASDTAPTFGWGTSAAYAYFMCAFIPDTSWPASPADAEATVSVVTSANTSQTPNSATASASGELSVILSGLRRQANPSSGAPVVSGPTGWTVVGNGGYAGGGLSGQIANGVSASYQYPVGSGAVTPGAESFTDSAAGNVYHFLFQELISGSPDVPQFQPGPAWFNQFKPWIQRPRPPVPPITQITGSSGSFVLAPLAFSATGTVSGVGYASFPDVPQISPGPTWLALYKPGLPRPRPLAPAPATRPVLGSIALAPLAFSGQGSAQNLFIFIGHYSVSYPDYVDANTQEILSCLPQHSYRMYIVGFRAGLTDPPSDGRWQGVPGIGDEIVFVRHYSEALAVARAHNATLQAVNAAKPYPQSGSADIPLVKEREVPREPSEHSKMLSAGRALNAELQARMARGEKTEED